MPLLQLKVLIDWLVNILFSHLQHHITIGIICIVLKAYILLLPIDGHDACQWLGSWNMKSEGK